MRLTVINKIIYFKIHTISGGRIFCPFQYNRVLGGSI